MQITKFDRQTDRILPSHKWIVLLSILLLLLTRAITVAHNLELHPDEPVFYEAANSLMHFVAGTTDEYTEVKEYPEGAIVLQVPFHIAAAILRRYTRFDISARLCGRLASIFYFSLGLAFGMAIEYQYFGKNKKSVLIYAAILIFSVMHIEQSRYGTGDALSFLLTMLILYLTLKREGLEDKKTFFYWLATGFFVGLLCAVKYPLIFWGLIPIIVAWKTETGNRNRACTIILIIVAIIVGFLFGSPKVSSDPAYVYRAVEREWTAYVLKGNITEVGGPVNHFLSLMFYSFLYAGFPFAPVFFTLAWKKNRKLKDKHSFLLGSLLPFLIIIFFVYNLFAKTLFMRTYYPYFFLMDLYVAEYLGKEHEKKIQVILYALLALFLIRGIYYISILTETWGREKLDYMISEASDESWNKTTLLRPGYIIAFHRNCLVNPQNEDLLDSVFENEYELMLDSGEMVITGGIEYNRGTGYFLPTENQKADQYCYRWDTFKRINQSYFAGAVYPVWYYYLFGYWIKGTTGCAYEFPTNFVYYRGA